MATRFTRRRVIAALGILVGRRRPRRHASRCARRRRATKARADKGAPGHARSSAPADLDLRRGAAAVALARRCPARCSRCARRWSRRRSPGDVRQIAVREGEAVQGRAGGRAHRHRRPRVAAHRPHRRAGERAGAARARREDARHERAAAQREIHLAERLRQRRVELQRRAGQRQVGRGAGAARAATR